VNRPLALAGVGLNSFGPNPTREEIEKALLLDHMVSEASRAKIHEAKTQEEVWSAFDDLARQGVYIIYGDIPCPFPQKGNIFGYGGPDSGSDFFARIARAESIAVETKSKETEYRSLLMRQLELCWQECPLCLKIGVGKIGLPYCRSCHDQIAQHLWDHLARYRVMGEAGKHDTAEDIMYQAEILLGENDPNPANLKALELTKGLIN
jgi:hypothetical protein